MKYPWIAEAIIEWKINLCRYKGEEMFCNECELDGEICSRLLELAKLISNKMKDEGELDDKN